jgi:nitroreductase
MSVMDIIEKRRAYRSLGPAAIDERLVRDLAAAASLAPSCFNKQPWRFVFAYDKDVLQRLREAMNKGNEWTRAASLIIAVASRRDLDCLVGEREYYLFDTGMATAFMILRATEMGLVAHPIAGFNEEKAKEILGIPGELRLITLVNVGTQQLEIEKSRPVRLPLPEIMRVDRF